MNIDFLWLTVDFLTETWSDAVNNVNLRCWKRKDEWTYAKRNDFRSLIKVLWRQYFFFAMINWKKILAFLIRCWISSRKKKHSNPLNCLQSHLNISIKYLCYNSSIYLDTKSNFDNCQKRKEREWMLKWFSSFSFCYWHRAFFMFIVTMPKRVCV
jgi:hypothetical protein